MFVPNVKDAQLSPLAGPATTPCAPGRREAGFEPRRKAERRKQSSYFFSPRIFLFRLAQDWPFRRPADAYHSPIILLEIITQKLLV